MIYVSIRNSSTADSLTLGTFENALDAEPVFFSALDKGLLVCMFGVWNHDHPLAGRYLYQSKAHREFENKFCSFPD
jgi:hypothetical protein